MYHTPKKDQQRTYLMMLMRCVSVFSSLYKGICCGYPFELHRLVDAIQMGIHNICLYKETDKKYAGCNLKTTESLACALIGVCAVIRSNTVLLKKSSDNIHVLFPNVLLARSDWFCILVLFDCCCEMVKK